MSHKLETETVTLQITRAANSDTQASPIYEVVCNGHRMMLTDAPKSMGEVEDIFKRAKGLSEQASGHSAVFVPQSAT